MLVQFKRSTPPLTGRTGRFPVTSFSSCRTVLAGCFKAGVIISPYRVGGLCVKLPRMQRARGVFVSNNSRAGSNVGHGEPPGARGAIMRANHFILGRARQRKRLLLLAHLINRIVGMISSSVVPRLANFSYVHYQSQLTQCLTHIAATSAPSDSKITTEGHIYFKRHRLFSPLRSKFTTRPHSRIQHFCIVYKKNANSDTS